VISFTLFWQQQSEEMHSSGFSAVESPRNRGLGSPRRRSIAVETPGPDIYLCVSRRRHIAEGLERVKQNITGALEDLTGIDIDGDGETGELDRDHDGFIDEPVHDITVTWDQSLQDVLEEVKSLYDGKRYALQFTHRLPGRGGKKPIETKVRVDDDSLFDVLVEYALDQPERRVECEAVETHWSPDEDGTENFVYSVDKEIVRCAPLARCYRALWAGPLKCFTLEHWYSPMSPGNLMLTAGVGFSLSAAMAVASYMIASAQEHSTSVEVGLGLDLAGLGAVCAVLAGPSFLYAFFVRVDQVGTFIFLRIAVLGWCGLAMSIFSLGCACWRNEETGMLGAALWLGAAVMQLWLYNSISKNVMGRGCHRLVLCLTYKKAEVHAEEKGLWVHIYIYIYIYIYI